MKRGSRRPLNKGGHASHAPEQASRLQRLLDALDRTLLIEIAVVAAVSCLMLIPEFFGLYAGLEGFAFDRFRSGLGLEPETNPVVVVEIDEAAYKGCFQGQSPLEPARLLQLVQAVSKAAVIGVDVVTDGPYPTGASFPEIFQDRFSSLDPKADGGLAKRVVWAAKANGEPELIRFGDWFFGHVPLPEVNPGPVFGAALEGSADWWAMPAYPEEDDLRLRRAARYVVWREYGTRERTFAVKVASLYPSAEKHGHEVEEAFLSQKRLPPDRILAGRLLGECGEAEGEAHGAAQRFHNRDLTAPDELAGKVALIGGTYAAGHDTHLTAFGDMPGVYYNADAIAAELSDGYIEEPPKWVTLIIDIGLSVGLLMAFRRWPASDARGLVLRAFAGFAVWVALSLVCFGLLHWLWVSWVGPFLSAVVSLIAVDLWYSNPKLQASHH
jgi:hypothetical protein